MTQYILPEDGEKVTIVSKDDYGNTTLIFGRIASNSPFSNGTYEENYFTRRAKQQLETKQKVDEMRQLQEIDKVVENKVEEMLDNAIEDIFK